MFSKQVSVCQIYYKQLNSCTIKKKSLNPCVSIFKLCFPENKINFINKSNFCSSYEGLGKHQSSSNSPENEFQSEDKIRLQKWIDMLRSEGRKVPNKISDEQVSELLSLPTQSGRRKRLYFYYVKQCAKLNDRAKKERIKELKKQKREEREKRPKGHIEYGLWKNFMFAKTPSSHIKNLLNHKLVNAMIFNQPLVIDLDFYDHMEKREISSLSKQLSFSITDNRSNSQPFNLTLCNIDFGCKKFQSFLEVMPNVIKPDFPMNITSKSYLDIFPKEKLVYLTPDAKDEMMKFDHEAIYIIGGHVKYRDSTPVTLTKAKKENIKTMKLPLHRYPIFKGRKDLAIPVVVNILLDLQKTGDWTKAFKNIPKKFIQQ